MAHIYVNACHNGVCMAAANNDIFDEFLSERGHETNGADWEREYNKKHCPECHSLHNLDATVCTVCNWQP
jgi:hypothetical protein